MRAYNGNGDGSDVRPGTVCGAVTFRCRDGARRLTARRVGAGHGGDGAARMMAQPAAGRRWGAANAMLAMLVMPPLAVLHGWLAFGKALEPFALGGMVLIVAEGLRVMQGR